MLIDRAAIAKLVPHAGRMLLLDGVVAWDEHAIECVATSHRRRDHPLAGEGGLAAVHAFEYGAQAAAVHGGLLAQARGTRARPGYLAALREATLAATRLDSLPEALTIRAVRLARDERTLIYRLAIAAGDRAVGRARATIVCW